MARGGEGHVESSRCSGHTCFEQARRGLAGEWGWGGTWKVLVVEVRKMAKI